MKFISAFVDELSGSVGGLTASRARGGVNYFRIRANPTNPQTERQTQVRANFGQLSQFWRGTLTDAQRDSWRLEAGGSALQGLNLYQRTNSVRLQIGLARVDEFTPFTPPPLVETGSPALENIALQLSQIRLTFTAGAIWASQDGAGLAVYVTPGIPGSRTFENRERLQFAVLGDGTTEPTSPVDEQFAFGNQRNFGDVIRARAVACLPNGTNFDIPIDSLVYAAS